MTETAISNEIGKFLTANAIPNWRCSVLNGQFRKSAKHKWYHIITGTPGLSDREFLLDDGSGRTVYLEVKKPGGSQSSIQKDFEADCIIRNVPYFIAKSVQDVMDILDIFEMQYKEII